MKTSASISLAIVFAILLLVAGAVVYHKDNTIATPSTFALSPTPTITTQLSPAQDDPLVLTWQPYKNDTYNFTVDVPNGWNQQEYKQESGVFLVAFSPNALPCSTCTYNHNGYYSIKVYNQKTDQLAYNNFTVLMKNVGKSNDIKAVRLDGKVGALYGNTVSVENNGFVYELALDNHDGKDKIENSKLFQKVADSFTFTNLVFTN